MKNLRKLFLAFSAYSVTSIALLGSSAQADAVPGCYYQYTNCSNASCANGGSQGWHIYYCEPYSRVKSVQTCCGA
jgi:hypothetical protein